MRKNIFKNMVLLGMMLAVFTGLLSFMFFTNDQKNSVVKQQPAELAPAANGNGIYNFNYNDCWFIQVESGSGWQNRTVGNGISLSITRATIRFSWGPNPYEQGTTGRYLYTDQGNWELRKDGQWKAGGTGVPGVSHDGKKGKKTGDWWSGDLDEGNYTFTANLYMYCQIPVLWGQWKEDRSINFHVDRTAPEIKLNDKTVDTVNNDWITKDSVKISYPDGTYAGSGGKAFDGDKITTKYSRNDLSISGSPNTPTSATEKLNIDSSLPTEGHYLVTATDSAGNTSSKRFTIDKTKPKNRIVGTDGVDYKLNDNKAYTKNDIVYQPTDNYSLKKVFVKYKDGPWVSSQSEADAAGYNVNFNDKKITVPKESGNGEWLFKAEDMAGNISDDYTVVLSYLDTFGNQENIRNSYISNYWYNVELPKNIFGEDGGIYTASSYDTALDFARTREEKERVTRYPDGSIHYVSYGNTMAQQVYTNLDEFNAAFEKHTTSYIKERSIAKNGTNNFNRIINDNFPFNTDDTALVRQWIAKPDFLPDDGLPIYLIRKDFKFKEPGFPYPTYVQMQKVADDRGLVYQKDIEGHIIEENGKPKRKDPITFDYNNDYTEKIENQVLTKESGGYFLVTEWDDAGNEEKYYVYIDLSAPTLKATYVKGDNTTESITFDETEVAKPHIFRYLSLNLNEIVDFNGIDQFVTMKINGRGLNDALYIQRDELPVLDGVTYYGNYRIELYDRSGNTLTFTVTIAGEAPRMKSSGTSNDNATCRLTLEVPDYNDYITNIKLFYINYEGEYIELYEDHRGVPVTLDTLQYTLTTGGKYTMWYKDAFDREVYCEPVFYLKGLPTGMLSGVLDGGITNKNVSLKYSEGNTLILYRIENGIKTEVPLDGTVFSQTYDETSHKYTAMLMANEETTAAYEFFLYKGDDKNLFVEYKFSIDCIIAPIYIYNTDGIIVDKSAATNKAFSVYWNETVSLRYYTNKTPGGEMGAVRYTMGTVLNVDGTYFFSLRDGVGNEESFTILLDSTVSYELGGEYIELGAHNYIAKDSLKFMITETTSVINFSSTPDVVNGGYITAEGNYTIWITDAYSNSVEIKITIDRTAPVITIFGAKDSGATNSNVEVHFSDYAFAYLVNSHDQIIGRVEDGQVFDTEGSYRIMATDIAGNVAYVIFAINRTIPYEANVPNGAFTTSTVSIMFLDTIANQYVIFNDAELIDVANKYTTPGKYLITVTDLLGNMMEYSFTILAPRVQQVNLQNLTDYRLIGATFNGVATLLEITDEQLYVDTNGKYVIKMENTKNNSVFEFNIEVDNFVDFNSNFTVGGLTTDSANISFNETVEQTVTLNGNEIKTAKTYKEPGDYKITATDTLGNVAEITFTILPKRTREIFLEHLDNYELVLITLDTKMVNADIVNNTLTFNKKGMLGIVLRIKGTDEVFSFGIEVDNSKPTVEIEKDAGSFKTIHASKENLTATLSCDGAEATAYTVGKKINGAGHYTLTITDDLGNTNVYTFDITEPLNWAAYASIGGLGLLGTVVLIVVWKAKRRIKTR